MPGPCSMLSHVATAAWGWLRNQAHPGQAPGVDQQCPRACCHLDTEVLELMVPTAGVGRHAALPPALLEHAPKPIMCVAAGATGSGSAIVARLEGHLTCRVGP